MEKINRATKRALAAKNTKLEKKARKLKGLSQNSSASKVNLEEGNTLLVLPKTNLEERNTSLVLLETTVPEESTNTPSQPVTLAAKTLDEIAMVNDMFKKPCFVSTSSTGYKLTLAESPNWCVLIEIPPGYPSEVPRCFDSGSKNGLQVKKLAEKLLGEISDGKPCLERLVCQMIEELWQQLPEIKWKSRLKREPRGLFSATYTTQLQNHMNFLRDTRTGYPPPMPSFSEKGSFNGAFVG